MKLGFLLTVLTVIILTFVSSITGYYILSNVYEEKIPVTRETFGLTKVIDGDTIEISTGEKVRLLGINTPEADEHYFAESKERLEILIGGNNVTLESGSHDKDQYGRLLRYVFVGDVFVNRELVRGGYATVYILNPNEKYQAELIEAEKEAVGKKLGLWVTSSNDCIGIVVFNYDAAGNDNGNLNDEYVTFQNDCGTDVDMSGWTVKDEGTSIYTFNYVSDAGARFTLYSGSGVDNVNQIYWDSARAIWNNAGDTLFMRDGVGNLVFSYKYP